MQGSVAPDQWISFMVGNETYAQPVTAVKEVIHYTPPVPVPGSPNSVDGILNVRGEVITVLCGHELFTQEAPEPSEDSRILILDTVHGHVGVSVDAVDEIVRIEEERIEANQQSLDQTLIVGTAQHQDKLFILVDLEHYYEQAVARQAPAS